MEDVCLGDTVGQEAAKPSEKGTSSSQQFTIEGGEGTALAIIEKNVS